MKQTDYKLLKIKPERNGVIIGEMKGDTPGLLVKLWQGISLSKAFPKKLSFQISEENEDFPNDTFFADFLINHYTLLLASKKVKDWFVKNKVPKMEFHAVSILDHKGKPISAEYFIINPLDSLDCIDKNKSKFKAIRGVIIKVDKFKLDESKLTANRPFFRILNYWRGFLIEKNLAQDFEKQEFSGIKLDDIP